MNKPALVIMARWPAIGRCKKRLAADIGAKGASSIQLRLTKHTIGVAQSLEDKGLIDIHFAISGLSPKAAKRWGKQEGIKRIILQGEGTLGHRMRRQVLIAQGKQSHFKASKTTILIGTDLPNLCQLDIIEAIEYLKKDELVLGPSFDGGYWLMGLTGDLVKPVATWPFSGIPWGTNQVFKKTIDKANANKIKPRLLLQKNDLDQLDDLYPWHG